MKWMDEEAPKGTGALEVRCGTAPCVETMRANTARSLRLGAFGLLLRCVYGLVVLTQKGDLHDHVLRPGEVFRTTRRGLVVAWALQDSGVMVGTDTEGRRAA